jgi:hypothetical protein
MARAAASTTTIWTRRPMPVDEVTGTSVSHSHASPLIGGKSALARAASAPRNLPTPWVISVGPRSRSCRTRRAPCFSGHPSN